MTGDPKQYAIRSEKHNPVSEAQADEAKEPTMATE
jgi:hypothetical protein